MMKTGKGKTIPAAKVFTEARKRPGYVEAYHALGDEFLLVGEDIRKARKTDALTAEERKAAAGTKMRNRHHGSTLDSFLKEEPDEKEDKP